MRDPPATWLLLQYPTQTYPILKRNSTCWTLLMVMGLTNQVSVFCQWDMLCIIWPRKQVGRKERKKAFWLAFACSCVAYTLGTHQMWRRQLTNWGGAWKRAGRGHPGHRPSLWAFPGSEEGGRVDFRRKYETIFEDITPPLNLFVWFFEIRTHICDKIWIFEYTHSVSHI